MQSLNHRRRSWEPSCSQPILDFLSTTDVGELVSALAEEDAQREESVWELRERREQEEERRTEAKELDGGGEEQPLFLPTPVFMASAEVEQNLGEAGGGPSILFRIYKPFQTTANANNNTNPYPSASLAKYAALPLALLASSITILHATISTTLHHLSCTGEIHT